MGATTRGIGIGEWGRPVKKRHKISMWETRSVSGRAEVPPLIHTNPEADLARG